MEPATTLPAPTDTEPLDGSRRRRARLADTLLGALAGLAAALAGLAVAEVVAAVVQDAQSPVLDVADRVVDGAPIWLKDLAIDWFGTNDKVALLVGIAVLLAAYAALVGVIGLARRRLLGIIAIGVGVSLFGLAGAYASQSTRRDAPWAAAVPSLVGAAVAVGVLIGLRHLFRTRPATATTQADGADTTTGATAVAGDGGSRRRFLVGLGTTAAGAAVVGAAGRRLGSGSGAAASRADLVLPRASAPLPAAPADVAVGVDGAVPFFTPNADFYRIDTAITVPRVPIDGWELAVDGMVERPRTLDFEELTSRELVEADITMTCVSNEVGGDLAGTARWLGVRLDDLLDEVGVDPDADQIVGHSVDGYTCGFPLAALDGRDALVAVGMNGEPLPLEHGYPARLVVPGLYGYVSATKWLERIELTRFDRFDQYWVERGWDETAPIKLASRIDTPRGLATLEPGTVAIAGVAWAQTRGVERVEVQIDDGDWVEADLAEELNVDTWRQWSLPWEATEGRHTIRVRAIEKGGPIQTAERAEPFPSGATGRHQIVVIVR
ncbi:MAG: molybdopterin-dependent oxidoreductase [Actinomycetota bacterium]|nr:molybdopterin-dependent oxidoreductase [Actinomycetota bacterium]